MLALTDLRLLQCFGSEEPFGGLHIILKGEMFQFPAIGRKFKKATLYQAVAYPESPVPVPVSGTGTGNFG